jgi:hypothetical protein
MTAEFDLTKLSLCERVWMWRRRRPSPSGRTGGSGAFMSKAEAAGYLAVDYDEYSEAEESDGAALPVIEMIRSLGGEDLPPRTAMLTPGEMCALARRRSGTGVNELCRELCITRPTYYLKERIGASEVMRMWERRGFTF